MRPCRDARCVVLRSQYMEWVGEPGVFAVRIGWSSDEGLETGFVVSGN
jgi:hypothetical protein